MAKKPYLMGETWAEACENVTPNPVPHSTFYDKSRLQAKSPYRSPALETLARDWARLLRLSDWDIDVMVVPRCEFSGSHTMGSCHAHIHSRTCRIYILRDEDREAQYKSDNCCAYFPWPSLETVLVHELLHIWTEQMGLTKENHKEESLEYSAMEQMVSSLAHALVNLKYSNRPQMSDRDDAFPLLFSNELADRSKDDEVREWVFAEPVIHP